jgi:hypothetical protein
MVPIGPGADGVMTFKMAGMFAETFDNLQVSSIKYQSSFFMIFVNMYANPFYILSLSEYYELYVHTNKAP